MAIVSSSGIVTQSIGANPPPVIITQYGTLDYGQSKQWAAEAPSLAGQPALQAVATHYFFADHLGTSQMEFANSGWPVWKGDFAPFGQELDTATTSNRYKFTGKERDTESGLDYFGARYYASSQGRWMSPDWAAKAEPVPYAKLDNPQSLNLYSYVYNAPLSKADPDGHCPLCLVALAVAVAESPAGQEAEEEAEEVAARYEPEIQSGLSRAADWAGARLAQAGRALEEKAQQFTNSPKNTERILQGEANGAKYRVPDLMAKVGDKIKAIGEVKDAAKLSASKQLTDLMGAAKDAGAKFSLYLGEKTQLTKPLATQLYNSGAAVYRYTSGKFVDVTKTLKPIQ